MWLLWSKSYVAGLGSAAKELLAFWTPRAAPVAERVVCPKALLTPSAFTVPARTVTAAEQVIATQQGSMTRRLDAKATILMPVEAMDTGVPSTTKAPGKPLAKHP